MEFGRTSPDSVGVGQWTLTNRSKSQEEIEAEGTPSPKYLLHWPRQFPLGDSLNWEHFGYIVNDFVPLKVRFVCSIQRTWWSGIDFEILEDHIMFELKGAFQSHRPPLPEKRHSNLKIWRDGGSTKLCLLQAVQFPAAFWNWAPSLHPSYLTVLVRTLYMVLSCPHGCLIIDTLLDFFFLYCF